MKKKPYLIKVVHDSVPCMYLTQIIDVAFTDMKIMVISSVMY